MSKNVHDRLREVRDEIAEMSRGAWALAVTEAGFEVTEWSVGNYERGDTDKVPAEYLKRVCERFDVSPEWLVTGEGPARWGRAGRRAQERAVIADYLEGQLMEYAERKPKRLGPDSLIRHDRNGDEDGAASATP